jgi:hypothetical protein
MAMDISIDPSHGDMYRCKIINVKVEGEYKVPKSE